MIRIFPACTAMAMVALCALAPDSGYAGPVGEAQFQARENALRTPILVPVDVPFDEAEASAALLQGNAQVAGALYYALTASGDDDVMFSPRYHKAVANTTVALFPMYSHMRRYAEMMADYEDQITGVFSGSRQHKIIGPDPRVVEYSFEAKTDEFGNFSFHDIKPGKYVLHVPPVTANGTYTANAVIGHTGNLEHTAPRQFAYRTPLYLEQVVEIKEGNNEIEARMRARPSWFHQYAGYGEP